MLRGTKARPDLRVVNGTERPDKAPAIVTAEPVDPSTVVRPGFVKGKAKRIWDAHAPGRIAAGFLRPEDAHLFGQVCVKMAKYEEDPGAFTAAEDSEMRKRMELFGMTGPVSRARVKIDSGEEKDPAARYLK